FGGWAVACLSARQCRCGEGRHDRTDAVEHAAHVGARPETMLFSARTVDKCDKTWRVRTGTL
ncbi:hypothetical protein XPU_0877, partial [Xanthomonas arboricola pv. pruni str. MAFF 311562]